ncbi:sulfotransferase family 2 domain-containing protein [Cerasicoccus arenae]|uniref:Sulfotransferase family protein n=1 Tax=Cerasicoccus arenae TaxID=424488 RepID=A0A8J3DEX2_9BACT|nr:sulfotransferase family 2 domain-containing protein [Cerasicoccus arenae]MBK1857653.1 sulfotransferase family 2 domain-containing protein [Cerasicoccus arenae]GHC12854.1 hypothetical protein GCM10007047_32750 [Cerasicoccus arenae]
MPLFYHNSVKPTRYMLVSYKCLYSQFNSSGEWKYLGEYVTPRLFLHAMVRKPGSAKIILRNPYDRTVSCFKDKYRKQPTRIKESNFYWQECHHVVFERLGVALDASDEAKTEALLAFSFKDFIQLLPEIYHLDSHFHPQHWLMQIHWKGRRFGQWPKCEILFMEQLETIGQLPGLNLGKRINSTGHVQTDFEFDEESKAIVHQLYRKDFELGSYPV